MSKAPVRCPIVVDALKPENSRPLKGLPGRRGAEDDLEEVLAPQQRPGTSKP